MIFSKEKLQRTFIFLFLLFCPCNLDIKLPLDYKDDFFLGYLSQA